MQTTYGIFKFLHIAAVIVWIGGLVAVSIINARAARHEDASVMSALAQASGFFGRVVVAPAAALTLFAGIVMVVSGGLSFGTLWIAWGLGGIVLSLLLGATLIRRAGEELGEAAQAPRTDPARTLALQRRLRTLNLLNLLVLFSVVWAMVFKPTL
jgi:uncharacterized membrane protein